MDGRKSEISFFFWGGGSLWFQLGWFGEFLIFPELVWWIIFEHHFHPIWTMNNNPLVVSDLYEQINYIPFIEGAYHQLRRQCAWCMCGLTSDYIDCLAVECTTCRAAIKKVSLRNMDLFTWNLWNRKRDALIAIAKNLLWYFSPKPQFWAKGGRLLELFGKSLLLWQHQQRWRHLVIWEQSFDLFAQQDFRRFPHLVEP